MAAITDNFISMAIRDTGSFSNPNARSQAVRAWLVEEGFSIKSIEDSDAKISFAVEVVLGVKPDGAVIPPQGTTPTRSNEDVSFLRSLLTIAPLFIVSVLLAFYLAPGEAPETEWPRFLLTGAAFSAVTLLVGAVKWKVCFEFGRLVAAVVALTLAPAIVFALSLLDSNRNTSVTTVFSEHGAPAIGAAAQLLLAGSPEQIGTVESFNSTQGFGFISIEGEGASVFVHMTALEDSGLQVVQPDQRVAFDVIAGRDGRSSAENVILLD